MKLSLPIFSFLTLSVCMVFGQQASVSGRITGVDGEGVPGVYVQLSNAGRTTVTDPLGNFKFQHLEPGSDTLSTSYVGFAPAVKKITLQKGQHLVVTVELEEGVMELREVTIKGLSESMALKESTASVSLIEAKPFYNRSISAPDLLNTVSGVQVRQNGGVGNSAQISIQGLTGRQVRLFVDGIPMDFLLPVEELGIGASLSMLPVNLMERMEVYKGVVPVSLGADALGGAINIVTRKNTSDYVEISGEHSSFNTTRTTLSARKGIAQDIFFGLSAFHTSSDNDYRVDDVRIVNEFGNPESISARKFHDRFRSYLVKGELGVLKRPWTDRFILSFSYGDLYDEIQHNFEMRQPYGQALNQATTYNTALFYEKYDIQEKLDINLYLGYNRINTGFTDTTRNIYDWRGEIIGRKTFGGEITTSQNHLELDGDNITGRVNLSYRFSPSSTLIFNGVTSLFTRSGSDPVAAEFYGEDYFENPVHVNKLVGGIGWEQDLFSGKLTSQTAFKGYHYDSEGFRIENGESVTITQDHFQPGVSQSFRWHVSNTVLSKLSYEYATRMPDRIETLGDFSAAVNANPDLRPETSHNLNLGAIIKKEGWSVEANGFFRKVDDIIILQAVPPPVLSKYENLLKATIAGVEGEVRLQPVDWLSIRLNATYQDLRNRSDRIDAGVTSDRYDGVRLPNQPYLFGNGELQWSNNGLFRAGDKLQAWWSAAYVQNFFRYWEIDGREEDKLTIPEQWLHHLGVSYTSENERITFSLESQNIFDAKAYDNFRVQKPGRSWHVKLRAFITKS